jgi:hypothetical protein
LWCTETNQTCPRRSQEGLRALRTVQALAKNTSIISLDLASNKIGDAGAQVLAANTSITSLDLTSNNIGPLLNFEWVLLGMFAAGTRK